MKKVQYYLKKMDKKKLAEAYFQKFISRNIDFWYSKVHKDLRSMTFDEFHKNRIKGIEKYVDRLRKLKTIDLNNSEQYIFIRYASAPFDFDELDFNTGVFKYTDVFSKKKRIEAYGYTFTHQDEIMSYLIADTYYNKTHMEDILVDIMHEASFAGYDENHDSNADKEIEKLNESAKEAREGKTVTFSFEEWEAKLFKMSKKQIKLRREYNERYEKSDLDKIKLEMYKARSKYTRSSIMFQVNEIRNNNIIKDDFV